MERIYSLALFISHYHYLSTAVSIFIRKFICELFNEIEVPVDVEDLDVFL